MGQTDLDSGTVGSIVPFDRPPERIHMPDLPDADADASGLRDAQRWSGQAPEAPPIWGRAVSCCR